MGEIKGDTQENGFTNLQLEAQESMAKVEEIRESAERVKNNLVGLKYPPLIYAEVATEELVDKEEKRNKSIFYLLNHRLYIDKNVIKEEELEDARYFTIEELIGRAKERADLLQQARIEIQTSDSDQPSLQRLVDEYSFRKENFFDIDKKTNKVVVRKLDKEAMEEVQRDLDGIAEYQRQYGEQISDVLKSGRTGIDIGVLILSEDRKNASDKLDNSAGGRYYSGKMFVGDLEKTGLIAVPLIFDPSTLKHEYAHFEDYVLRTENRDQFEVDGMIIGEINSYISSGDLKRVREGDLYSAFEDLKVILINHYLVKVNLPKHIDVNDVRRKIISSVDAVKHLYKNGCSVEVISSILMHANKFEDITQWGKADGEEIKELTKKTIDINKKRFFDWFHGKSK